MAAKTTKATVRSGRAGADSKLMKHRDVARMLGMTTQNIRRWVARGSFPEPHSIVETTWFYRADLVKAYHDTGKWPDGTKFKRTRRLPDGE